MKILLIAYDNDSHIHHFPLGLAYIATSIRDVGIEVEIYNQDVYHYSEEHLLSHINNGNYDAVGLGVVGGYYQYRKLLKISEAINKANKKPFFILGGHGPAPEPEYFLKKTGADVIVIGEGEATIVELLEHLAGKKPLKSINGIAYLENDIIKQTEERELIKDIDTIPYPAWDLFPIEHYVLQRLPKMGNSERMMPVLSGRGCPYSCNFCYRMDKGFRGRSPESIVAEIMLLKELYNVKYINFSDELLMSSILRTEDICKALLKNKLNIKWLCNGRLNFARKDILALMKKAGCVYINYGIESLDEKALQVMNKKLKVSQIVNGIENTLSVGISPGFNIIFGNLGETAQSLRLGVEFLLKYDDNSELRTIRPVTPYPGSPLYYHAIKNGLLKDCEDFYENKHVNSDLLTVNFTDLSNDKFHQLLFQANKTLISKYYNKACQATVNQAESLYSGSNVNFRGFRQT